MINIKKSFRNYITKGIVMIIIKHLQMDNISTLKSI